MRIFYSIILHSVRNIENRKQGPLCRLYPADVYKRQRIDRALQEEYNDLAAKTNRSRNELISMALQYALDHMELKDE